MLWKRLAYLLPWRRRAAERDMRDELQSIAAMARPGELGNLTIAAEDARAEWGWTRLEQTIQDLNYALRTLARSLGFTATAVLSLALGIGANTALFTIVNAVTWRLLPVADPETLLLLGQRQGTAIANGFSYQQYAVIRDHTRVLDLAAYGPRPLNVSSHGVPGATAEGPLVPAGHFQLGVAPAAGRALGPTTTACRRTSGGDDQPWLPEAPLRPRPRGRGPADLASGVAFTIVGVTPPEFFGVEVGTSPICSSPS